MQVAVRQFLPCHVGKQGLALCPGLIDIGELVPEFVAMETIVVLHVEIISRHAGLPPLEDRMRRPGGHRAVDVKR